MRITPLHNIRQPGLIPNGFQKEEAPPPTPDQHWQPDMRYKEQALTDSRHAVEYFNPLSRMEANALNRTGPAHPAGIEMGRDRERVRADEGEARSVRVGPDYRRLLELLRERQAAWEREGKEALRTETRELGEKRPVGQKWENYRLDRRREPWVSMEEDEQLRKYYYRKGIEAYRQAQRLSAPDSHNYEV